MLIEQRSILLGRFSRTIFDKRSTVANKGEKWWWWRRKKLSNLDTIRNPICERSKENLVFTDRKDENVAKLWKKKKNTRGVWDGAISASGWPWGFERRTERRRSLTGKWRERNDRKTDTLWQREWNKRWPWGGVYWRRDHELGKDREKDLSGLILENKLVEQKAFKKVESEKDLLSFEGNRSTSDNSPSTCSYKRNFFIELFLAAQFFTIGENENNMPRWN